MPGREPEWDLNASELGGWVTWGPAVTAHVVARHPLHFRDDLLGQLLDDVVFSSVVIALKGVV